MIKREWVGFAIFTAFRYFFLAVRDVWFRLAVLVFELVLLFEHSVNYGNYGATANKHKQAQHKTK